MLYGSSLLLGAGSTSSLSSTSVSATSTSTFFFWFMSFKTRTNHETIVTYSLYLCMVAVFVVVLTMPPLYEKHEDQVDSYALKAKARLKRQYSKLDEKVLQKLPKVPFISDNKQH